VTFLVIGADVVRSQRSFVEINIVQFTYGRQPRLCSMELVGAQASTKRTLNRVQSALMNLEKILPTHHN
jgi:hypothetical protein